MVLDTSGSTGTLKLTGSQELSVQAKVEQIAGAVARAHRILDQVDPLQDNEKSATSSGLLGGLRDLDVATSRLVGRLTNLFGDPSTDPTG